MKAEETAVITGLTNKAALRRGLQVGAASAALLMLVGCLGSNNNDIAGTDGRTNPNENPNLKYDVSITRTLTVCRTFEPRITAAWVMGKVTPLRKTTSAYFLRTC
jgi:hypothetical protein